MCVYVNAVCIVNEKPIDQKEKFTVSMTLCSLYVLHSLGEWLRSLRSFQFSVDVAGIISEEPINEKKQKKKQFTVCRGARSSSIHSRDVVFPQGNITSRARLKWFSSS